jgi:magnesium transporter
MATLDELRAQLARGGQNLRAYLAEIPMADYLHVWSELTGEEEIAIFSSLSPEARVDLMSSLPPRNQELLITDLSGESARHVLEEMEPDDLTDFIQTVSPEVREAVWGRLTPDARDETRFLLRFDEDDAAGIMTPRYLAISANQTVAQALAWVRRNAVEPETIYNLYVLDGVKRLIGVVSLRELLASDDQDRVSAIMNRRVISVREDTDQEEAARTLETYDLSALPVVDTHNRLLGIVTFDDIIDVIREEQTEDVHKMAAMTPSTDRYMESSVWDLVKKRVPWLAVLLLAATLTTNVLSGFESVFVAATVLTLFIPTIIGTGGNSSTQASTHIIRSLATGEVHVRDIGRVLGKEITVGVLLGLAMGTLVFARSLLLPPPVSVLQAATVGIALAAVIVVATTVGAFSPMLISWIGIDPTVVAAPLMATVIDLAGLTIYFLTARALLGL